jgi:hypothetical protein
MAYMCPRNLETLCSNFLHTDFWSYESNTEPSVSGVRKRQDPQTVHQALLFGRCEMRAKKAA